MTKVFTFDGIDGSGKTTLIGQVRKQLEEEGKTVLVVNEPRGTAFGADMFASKQKHDPFPAAAIHAMFAARMELFLREIVPFANASNDPDRIVLLDRHVLSTRVYQGQDCTELQEHIDHLYRGFAVYISSWLKHCSFSELMQAGFVMYCDPDVAAQRIYQRSAETGTELEPDEKISHANLVSELLMKNARFIRMATHRTEDKLFVNYEPKYVLVNSEDSLPASAVAVTAVINAHID